MPIHRTRPWSKREVLTYLDRILPALEKLNHFEFLDVSTDADNETIQAAFHAMASRLHPDRHRNALTSKQYECLIVAYARIAEAYRILRNPQQREFYVRKIARQNAQKTVHAQNDADQSNASLALLSPKVQQLYRRAIAAARTGDKTSAILNLRMALAKHPQSDFLRDALRSLQKGTN